MSCAPKAPGVACVISEVATSPVDFLFLSLAQELFSLPLYHYQLQLQRLYVLIPADIAVAADAESVIFSCSSSGYVFVFLQDAYQIL